MKKVTIGLIGYGVVGSGVVKLLNKRKNYIKGKYDTEVRIKTLCDRSVDKKDTALLATAVKTTDFNDILNDPEINVVVELIGGMNPAKKIVEEALKKGKHVITANKELIANKGQELFQLAQANRVHLYYESSVGAGIPIIKTLTEGILGNTFEGIFGIINGTCNFILSEMTEKNYTFNQALEDAQKNGYAESDPTLDINGMDSAHKLAILVNLAFGKFIAVKDIYVEGITHIAQDDIEHAKSLGHTIKLLAIAKKNNNAIEARVHPTLISKSHPLASINHIYNAFVIDANPLGNVILSGEGAGQMAAATGVVSDIINLSLNLETHLLPCNIYTEDKNISLNKIDDIQTKFYLRFTAMDKPGVLSKITGILGEHGIGINSLTQKEHSQVKTVPVIILTELTSEKSLRMALTEIHKLPVIKNKTVAIRMEKLS
ncbi:MAG: homoserine dehydrogenase [Candidatus Omnitrophica bacterium]|nr:homoserine dehydrogenase [Candidatus Omnitrophota bacterium]MCB9748202.1 homoserine dehydrogenase [Candidatus Omnitrophota bacterium]